MPISGLKAGFREVLAALERWGLLLVHDGAFPSLTGLTVGEPIRGSWWAHPLSNDIYMVGQQLQHCGDVALTKLVSGKETYLHRRLWPHLVAIGISREPWQLDGLGAGAMAMLGEVDRHGSIRLDHYRGALSRKEASEDAKTLALRMLAYADDVHTHSGAHAKRLATWESWAKDHEVALDALPTPSAARQEFERIVNSANAEFSASAFLPWQNKLKRPRLA